MALEQFQDFPARHRLVGLLSCRPYDDELSLLGRGYDSITLEPIPGEAFNFRGHDKEGHNPAWWAEKRLDGWSTDTAVQRSSG